jgi:pyruvyltransferase
MTINIFYFGGKNFGDAVNKIFWEKLTNKKTFFDNKKNYYMTTGSIMNLVTEKSIILGTGFISQNSDLGGRQPFYTGSNKLYCKPLKIVSVRGPLTKQKLLKLNLNCPSVFGDPLILFPCIYSKKKAIKKNIVGIIPHYIDKNNKNVMSLKKNLERQNFNVKMIDIEVGNNYQKLIDEINDCQYIISSSLHGIIMGIVYKKKTVYCKFSNNVVGKYFKFRDFFSSINYNHNFNTSEIFTANILKYHIRLKYSNLINMSVKLINTIPFIEENRKKELIRLYNNFYN